MCLNKITRAVPTMLSTIAQPKRTFCSWKILVENGVHAAECSMCTQAASYQSRLQRLLPFPDYAFAALRCCGMPMPSERFLAGEATEREKSIMYLTVLGQNRHGVSWTSGSASSATLNGNERKHSVQVTTMNGTPVESFPLRGIQTGADCF